MANNNLVDYIKNLVEKGYDISTIRNFLLRYGYSIKEVDDAINSTFKPTIRHEIHLSHATILVVMFVFVSLLGIASIYYFKTDSTPTQLLDFNLEPITTTVEPGQSIAFLKEISNLGSSKRYDVIIKQEIINPKTNRVITQKIETRAIETFGSTQTKILVPVDAQEGDYLLKATVTYDDKNAVATLPVKIIKYTKMETCLDGIKNQNEEGADCGGVCKPCEKQIPECNDNNPCTEDAIENNICVHKPVVPCCGNNICEEQERENCPADCQKTETSASTLVSTESLDKIKELAKLNPGDALHQCAQMDVPDLKDTCIENIGETQHEKSYCNQINNPRIKDSCYSNIAQSLNDNSLCQQISIDSRKDSCYMTFVLDNKDYSVCNKITNKQLRESCESLKQLYELNQQQNQNNVHS